MVVYSVARYIFQEVIILQHYFGPRFRILHWCTDQLMTDALAQMELTAAQGRIMGYLSCQTDPPCPRDIEEHFHLSHPSVSGTLNRLERKGFIRLCPDETDRRCKRIHLSAKGQECLERMAQNIESIETKITDGFTPDEQEQFSTLLNRAITNMGGTCCPSFKEESI